MLSALLRLNTIIRKNYYRKYFNGTYLFYIFWVKVYKPRYMANLATGGSKRETTK